MICEIKRIFQVYRVDALHSYTSKSIVHNIFFIKLKITIIYYVNVFLATINQISSLTKIELYEQNNTEQ